MSHHQVDGVADFARDGLVSHQKFLVEHPCPCEHRKAKNRRHRQGWEQIFPPPKRLIAVHLHRQRQRRNVCEVVDIRKHRSEHEIGSRQRSHKHGNKSGIFERAVEQWHQQVNGKDEQCGGRKDGKCKQNIPFCEYGDQRRTHKREDRIRQHLAEDNLKRGHRRR